MARSLLTGSNIEYFRASQESICGFWAVECRARGGDVAGARRDLGALLGYANDVGLFAEEIDPETGAALGNFPQAFTHIGLINAAITLEQGGEARSAVPNSDGQEAKA